MRNVVDVYLTYVSHILAPFRLLPNRQEAVAICTVDKSHLASPPSYREDERLVDRACFGDKGAFRQLFECYSPLVYRIAYRMLGDPDNAADLTQDVFVRAYERLSTLKHGVVFQAWITRITVNMVRDVQRRLRIDAASLDAPPPGMADDAEWSLPASDPPLEHPLLMDELSQQIQAALLQLSPEHRTVIILHHLESLPVDEISATLHVPVGTIKSRLARARAQLRQLLDPYFSPEVP